MKGRKEGSSAVYLGPPVSGIKTGTVFTAGLPEALEKLKEQCPAAGILIVPVRRYAEVYRKLSVSGCAQAIAYQKIKEFISKGGSR